MPDGDANVHASLNVDYDLYALQGEFKYEENKNQCQVKWVFQRSYIIMKYIDTCYVQHFVIDVLLFFSSI